MMHSTIMLQHDALRNQNAHREDVRRQGID